MLWAFHGPLHRKLLSAQTLRPWKPNLFKCLVIVKIHGMIIFLFKIFGLKCKVFLLKVCFSLSTARNMCCTGCQSSGKHHMVKEQQASGGWWERCVYLCMLQKEKSSLEWLGQVWHLFIAGRQMFFFLWQGELLWIILQWWIVDSMSTAFWSLHHCFLVGVFRHGCLFSV